jgi:hypothetical protein
MGRGVDIPCMGKGVKIPSIGVQNTMGMRSIYHGEVVKIPWVVGSKYHGYVGIIPYVGVQNTIDRGSI